MLSRYRNGLDDWEDRKDWIGFTHLYNVFWDWYDIRISLWITTSFTSKIGSVHNLSGIAALKRVSLPPSPTNYTGLSSSSQPLAWKTQLWRQCGISQNYRRSWFRPVQHLNGNFTTSSFAPCMILLQRSNANRQLTKSSKWTPTGKLQILRPFSFPFAWVMSVCRKYWVCAKLEDRLGYLIQPHTKIFMRTSHR